MIETPRAYRGMVTAPHHLASEAGLRVLREGGNAIEAMIAAASTICVVYPHMNGLGGDGFWLISEPGSDVKGIDACGAAAGAAGIEFYHGRGHDSIPSRGPLAALTVAGVVSSWDAALRQSTAWGGRMPLERLLEDAIHYAEQGAPVTGSLNGEITDKRAGIEAAPGFADVYLPGGAPLEVSSRFAQPRVAETLRRLAGEGLDSFYRGDLARSIAADLERAGSPVSADDLARHQALDVLPLTLQVAGHQLYNMPPPTQGLASLMLLGVFERLGVAEAETAPFVHGLVEAAKQAFRVRDAHVVDPAYMSVNPADYLTDGVLSRMAADIDRERAAPWPHASNKGDTVWLGAIDGEGRAVSCIQSVYWEFGSGTVLEETGITWQNRGTSFSLDASHHNALKPHRRPFHTIQPALARLSDGRTMSYGTMGGEGQPQTQAMIFARHVLYGQELQPAVSAPRWLLGRTWGSETTSLRMESRIDPAILQWMQDAGHPVEMVGDYDAITGHAGALVHHPDGLIEGASDPRCDGAAIGF